MFKDTIAVNFSKSAATYERYAVVQRRCAEELVEMLGDAHFSKIFEIGCGTGLYTKYLRKKFTESRITAVDISEGMIAMARKNFAAGDVDFFVADGVEVRPGYVPDLVTSNASFHWFGDFEKAVGTFSSMMEEENVFCFSMYGPRTFKELGDVLSMVFGTGDILGSTRFFGLGEIKDIVSRYFSKVKIREEYFIMEYPSVWDLLYEIKYTGSRGEGITGHGLFLGKNRIDRIEKEYRKKYGSIRASHHVYFCRAEA